MIRTKSLPVWFSQTLWHRIAVVVVFAAITAVTARITFYLPFTPVPITLQTLAVVLSGLVLGSRGGALAQMTYLGLVASGLPVDANGLGMAAFFGPTAGYLVAFVPAAFSARTWWGNFAATLTGVAVLYMVGASWLAVILGSWQKAWLAGVVPFILPDAVKAAIAAATAESGKFIFRR